MGRQAKLTREYKGLPKLGGGTFAEGLALECSVLSRPPLDLIFDFLERYGLLLWRRMV